MTELDTIRNPRAFIDKNGGYQSHREGVDKLAHDAWVKTTTWNLTIGNRTAKSHLSVASCPRFHHNSTRSTRRKHDAETLDLAKIIAYYLCHIKGQND